MSIPLRVAVRVRPSQSHDGSIQERPSVTLASNTTVQVHSDAALRVFSVDTVFGPDASQHDVFTTCALPLVDAVLSGVNGCMFAFGQTGAGKTYSMLGPEGGRCRDSQDGVLPRAAAELFRRIARLESDASAAIGAEGFSAFEVRASFIEVFREHAYDLLGSNMSSSRDVSGACAIREQLDPPRAFADGAEEVKVTSVASLLEVVARGAANRATAATGVHAHSSRSHALLILSIEHRWRNSCDADMTRHHSQKSYLTLVDLAGAESMERSHGGSVDAAGVGTNMGLLVLGRVIQALAAGDRVPYRDSTLTRLLQTSLGGSSVTQMLACISPAALDADQSVRTLQYAAAARDVRCTPEVARICEELNNNPMIGDHDDENADKNRRAIWIETRSFGDVFARCVGDFRDPLILYVHGSGPRNSSMAWNQIIMDTAKLAASNTHGLPERFFHVAIDCPDYGRSPGDKQSIRSYPGALLSEIISSLGRKSAVALCGSSQGCAAVFNAALEYPKIAQALAVVHPVAHAPQRFTALALPTLMIFDTEDAGHPVSVGRQMRRYLPHNRYFEFTRSRDGNWEAQHFGEELVALLAQHWQHQSRRGGGRPDPKLPELVRVAGGFRAWSEIHGREWGPMTASSSEEAWTNDAGADASATCADDENAWRTVLDPSTNVIQYQHVNTGRLSKVRPPGARVLVERLSGHNSGALSDAHGHHRHPAKPEQCLFEQDAESEDEEERLERLEQEKAAAVVTREEEASQTDCDLCGHALLNPTRLVNCRCAFCECCVQTDVLYFKQCPCCGASVKKPRGIPCSDSDELCARLATRMADPLDRDASRFEVQQSRSRELNQQRASSRRIVLEYGNTAKVTGSKTAYTTFLKTHLQEGLCGADASRNAVSKVDFNINPGYTKPTGSVKDPDMKHGAKFEYSMARAFPCFMTVHFRQELGLPNVEIQYQVLDADETTRRIVVEAPSSATALRRGKSEIFAADPPRNGWLACGSGGEFTLRYLSKQDEKQSSEAATEAPKKSAESKASSRRRSSRSQAKITSSCNAHNESAHTAPTARLSPYPLRMESEDMKSQFAVLDPDGLLENGLDLQELSQVLKAGNPLLPGEEIAKLFTSLPKDGRDRVAMSDMLDYLHNIQPMCA